MNTTVTIQNWPLTRVAVSAILAEAVPGPRRHDMW